jgi:type IV secretory pathway VirB10-like protein
MFGFIKNLVKKSDNNFFLELKEEVEAKIDEAKKEIKEITDTKETKETKKVEAKQPASNGAKPAPAPAKPALTVSATKPAVTPDSNGKMSRKDSAAAAKAAKIEAAKASKEAEAASSDPAQLIARATAKKQQPVAAPVETNFATKYLMTPSSNGRRRPGANMNSYLEMARQVKTPSSNK